MNLYIFQTNLQCEPKVLELFLNIKLNIIKISFSFQIKVFSGTVCLIILLNVLNMTKREASFQDRAPSHTSIKTQDWCKRHFPRFRSKEMCLVHFLIWNQWIFWSILKAKISSVAYPSDESLKILFWENGLKYLRKNW